MNDSSTAPLATPLLATKSRSAIGVALKYGLCFIVACGPIGGSWAGVVFERHSAYHHIQVVDEAGTRTLSFNGSRETKMLLKHPLQGHFEYTEYFHMPWLWNTNIQRVLMMGLGGGSAQRAFQHYYTNVFVDTVEIDPVVIDIAKRYFRVAESSTHKIHNNDGRVFLRRVPKP